MKSSHLIKSVVLSVLVFSSFIFAQNDKKIVDLDETAIGNLKTAILSDNPGLRKSAIYFAGKYALNEVSDELIKQLNVETEPALKIMLIRVLYIIDDEKYMSDIHNVALYDKNIKVKKMATAIYTVMKLNNLNNIANN